MDSKGLSRLMGERLKEERERLGLSLIALSKAIYEKYGVRIAKDSLINYEFADDHNTKAYKNNGMRVEYLRYLAGFYEVPTDWLLGLSNVRTLVADVKQVCNYTGLEAESVKTLHTLNTKWNKPTFALILIDELLKFGTIYRAGKSAWKGAMAEAQNRKLDVQDSQKQRFRKPPEMSWGEYAKTERYKEEMRVISEKSKRFEKKMVEDALKPIEEVSGEVEIGVYEAAKLFENITISPLKNAVERAYRKYIDKMSEIIFGDEYEKYLQLNEHKRTSTTQEKTHKRK